MGTVKDIVELTTQLAKSVKDRKLASELMDLQTLILQLQSEQAVLHEKNIELREEKAELSIKIAELEKELAKALNKPASAPDGVPTCPNCSTESRPFYMRPIGKDFQDMVGGTHECPQCKYSANIQ